MTARRPSAAAAKSRSSGVSTAKSRDPSATKPPLVVTIRNARGADVPALLELMAPFNRSERIPWRAKPVEGALRRLLREPRLGTVMVAQQAKSTRLVGYVVATFNFDLEFAGLDAFVTELFVRPEVRERGVGRRLLATIAARMRAAGAGALHLLVRPDNLAARLLYEATGFEEVPRSMMTRTFRRRR